jgi:hypothetical protein
MYEVELSAASTLRSMQGNSFCSGEICSWRDRDGNLETPVAAITIQHILRYLASIFQFKGRIEVKKKHKNHSEGLPFPIT